MLIQQQFLKKLLYILKVKTNFQNKLNKSPNYRAFFTFDDMNEYILVFIRILSILLVVFGSLYNLFAAEEYAKKRLRIIPRIVRYIAYAIGILCSGYVVNLIVNDFPS